MKRYFGIKRISIPLFFCFFFYGCATFDPVPPMVEFYEIDSKDIPQGTFNLVTERNDWKKEKYEFSPYIKFKDSGGCVWLISIMSGDPATWCAYRFENNRTERVEFVLSKEYKNMGYGQLNKIIYSDLMTNREN